MLVSNRSELQLQSCSNKSANASLPHMSLDQELSLCSIAQESVLTIGVFDGVHRGHTYLLSHLITEARNANRMAGVVTFRNHPASVLQLGFKPRYLTSFEERLNLMNEYGVDFIAPITFNVEVSRMTAAQFAIALRKRLHMKGLIVGPDFAMGQNREGDPNTLARLGEDMGFNLIVVDSMVDELGQPVRSTTVREALDRGDLHPVHRYMGRNFSLDGTVVRGQGRGASLGYPTANLQPRENMLIPGDGIYATWIHIDADRYMAASSIGFRPTFEDRKHTIESYVIDFNKDLYGKQIRLEFVSRLRDEKKFDSIESLKKQLHMDVNETKSVLQSRD